MSDTKQPSKAELELSRRALLALGGAAGADLLIGGPLSGQLAFSDYQMSEDILVTVQPSFNRQFPIRNGVLIASITNVALDPLESTAIPPPTASTTGTNALLNILSQVAMVIPYEALGAELTFDHDRRNRLFGWREGAMILGTVFAAVLPDS